MRAIRAILGLIVMANCTLAMADCPDGYYKGWFNTCYSKMNNDIGRFIDGFKNTINSLGPTLEQNLSNAPDGISKVVETPRELVQGLGCALSNNQGRQIGGGNCRETEKMVIAAEKANLDAKNKRIVFCQDRKSSLVSNQEALTKVELRKTRLEAARDSATKFAPHFTDSAEIERIRQIMINVNDVTYRLKGQVSREEMLAQLGQVDCSDVNNVNAIHQKLYCMGEVISASTKGIKVESEQLQTTLVLLPFVIESLASEAQDYSEAVALVGPENMESFLKMVESAGGGQMLYRQQVTYFDQEIAVTLMEATSLKSEISMKEQVIANECQGE